MRPGTPASKTGSGGELELLNVHGPQGSESRRPCDSKGAQKWTGYGEGCSRKPGLRFRAGEASGRAAGDVPPGSPVLPLTYDTSTK